MRTRKSTKDPSVSASRKARANKKSNATAQRQQASQRRQARQRQAQRRQQRYQLSGQQIHSHAVDVLQRHLRLRNHSDRCTATVVLTVLLAAAGQCASIAAACYRLHTAPSEQTIYNALKATLPDYSELERRVQRSLRAHLPARLRRRRQRLAIDLTLIPYHGEPEAALQEIYRGQAKHGTSHFHAYASLYVVYHGQRYTVALIRVELGACMKDVVQRLLHWGRRAEIRPKLLLLDRGFYSVAVLSYLKRARVPFLMPAVARGRKPAVGTPPTGIRAFRLRKRGGWGEHTLCSGQRRTKVAIAVCCGNYRGQWKRHGRYAWVYAYWGFRPGSLRWVADTYRTRFGIETSYRQMHQGRIKTTTRSPLQRYLYVALALLLRNIWVWLHWAVLSTPRRGRRRLNQQRMTFEGMLVFLVHVAEARFGYCDQCDAERSPQTMFASGG